MSLLKPALAVLSLARERPDLARKALRRLLRGEAPLAVWRRALNALDVFAPSAARAPYFGLDKAALGALAARAERAAAAGPLISVITPMKDTPPAFLRACAASVLSQPYRRLELILVDDGSRSPHALRQAMLLAAQDPRIRVLRLEHGAGISRATNAGLAAARGELIAFLDHDDELTPDALTVVAERFTAEPALDVAYTDQFKIDAKGEIIDHHFKPAWSPLHLLGVMYVGHLLVARTVAARGVGGCDPALDGVQDYDLVLRLHEAGARIGHIAQPLYKWRAASGSTAAAPDAKAGIAALQQRAVQAHLARVGRTWAVEPHPTHGERHRMLVAPAPSAPAPAVSIVIPSRDQGEMVGRCLGSIRRRTAHAAYEIVVVDDHTTDPLALHAFGIYGARALPLEGAFTFSAACNQGARASRGALLLFLNNDTEVTEPDWLQRLSLWFEEPEVGVVGPVLTYPDGRVQHAGVVLGARGTADHVMRGFEAGVDGYAGSLCAAREVSAVTGACLMMRRGDFAAVGGFSTDYARHYQDVDLCLRVRERGQSVVCTPRPRLIHHEGLTRGDAYDFGDRALLIDRWRSEIEAPDPYYSPWFDRETLDYRLVV